MVRATINYLQILCSNGLGPQQLHNWSGYCDTVPDRKGWHTFAVKGQIINILWFVGHMVSVAAAQLCHCRMRRVINNRQKNGSGCVLIKCYLQERVVVGIWLVGCSWPTPGLCGDSWSWAGHNHSWGLQGEVHPWSWPMVQWPTDPSKRTSELRSKLLLT